MDPTDTPVLALVTITGLLPAQPPLTESRLLLLLQLALSMDRLPPPLKWPPFSATETPGYIIANTAKTAITVVTYRRKNLLSNWKCRSAGLRADR
jgi:hypothetical protein